MDGQRRTGAGGPLRPGDPERVGAYTVLGRIGEGGMGAVYLGRAPDGRQVAIKVVRPELAQDAGFVARFREEVSNAERVASFCTAQVLDHGESGGRAYMVTEYIDGVSLKDYVKENGELSPGMLQGVAVGVAAALAAIHAAGLIHRDLKPANVMLSFSGPRVIDFGIARALDAASGLTMTGQLVGSPGWMAPERILQQQVTTAADVFSWGCLVAFARNGVNPFGTGDFSVMSARLLHADPQVGELPAPLDRLVRAALDKDPRNRPTARELLLTMVGGETTEAAVLSTLTAWQAPVPLLPHGDTRVVGDTAGRPPAAQGGTPPAHGGPPTAVGPAAAPAGFGPRGAEPYGGPPTVAAGAEPPATPTTPTGSGTRPSHEQWSLDQGRDKKGGGRRAALAGAAALVLAAAGVTGWLLTHSDGGGHKGPARKAAAGPAPLPTATLLVRIDRRLGWPTQCFAGIGTLAPATHVAATLIDDSGKCDFLPRWSPDRKRIAFTRSTGAVNELWVTNANGTGTRLVTDRMAARSRVAWSPDGTKVAMVAKAGSARQIDVVTLSDGSFRQLTDDSSEKDDPAWCGNRVAFWSKRSGTQQIYTVDVNAQKGPPTQVTRLDHDVNDPAFSPDCTTMAYTDQVDPAHRHLWITTSDGNGPAHQLTSNATRDMDATWSPDGTWIAFARGTTEQPSVWAIRLSDGHEERLSPPGRFMAHPDWS